MDYKLTQRTYRPRGRRAYQEPFPDIYRTTVAWRSNGYIYQQHGPISAGVGPRTVYNVVSANNIFDPDIKWGKSQWSSRGHSPLKDVYQYYMVEKATMVVRFASLSSTVTSNQLTTFIIPVSDGDPLPSDSATTDALVFAYPYASFKDFTHENINVLWHKKTWRPQFNWPARNPYEDPKNWWPFAVKPDAVTPQYRPYFIFGITYNDMVTALDTETPDVAASNFRCNISVFYDIICVRKRMTWSVGMEGMFTTEDPIDTIGQGEDPDETGSPTEFEQGGTLTGTLPAQVIGTPDA